MSRYIKLSSKITKGKNSYITYQNPRNTTVSYNKFVDPKFLVNALFYKDSINYSVGQNLITKPYWIL